MKRIVLLIVLILGIGISLIMIMMKRENKAVTERITALDLTADKVTYTGGNGSGYPTKGNIMDTKEGWEWYLYEDIAQGYTAKTLVLKGINLSTAEAKAMIVPEGTTIVINGINAVASTYNHAGSSYGLYACGTLTITGESADSDIFMIAGGNPGSAYTVTSIGIHTVGEFIMKGGCVEAIGGEAKFSRGVSVSTDLIMEGGKLCGQGGTASNGSAGLWMAGKDSSVSISQGTVSVAGGQVKMGTSYGLYGEGCNVNVTGGDFIAAGAVGSGSHSFGVHILTRGTFVCKGGTLALRGGDMAINIKPEIIGEYEYKAGEADAFAEVDNWSKGKINDFHPFKYVSIRFSGEEEIE